MPSHIYLDDIRAVPQGWTLAKNYEECIALLSEGDCEYLSLDHDLADEHYCEYQYEDLSYYEDFVEKTGYDVCKWLVENWDKVPNLKAITLHTANPAGRINMRSILNRYKPDTVTVFG